MKKIIYGSLFLTFLGFTLISSCSKETPTTEIDNTVIIKSEASGPGAKLEFTAGHLAAECAGQGLCFAMGSYFGEAYGVVHIPCQWTGNDCKWTLSTSSINFQPDVPDDFEFDIENYSDEEFAMPSRSVFYPKIGYYLNVPQQILNKTNNPNGFLFKGVVFTTSPSYINE